MFIFASYAFGIGLEAGFRAIFNNHHPVVIINASAA